MSVKSRFGPAVAGGIAGAVIAAGTLVGAGILDDDDNGSSASVALPSAAAPGSAATGEEGGPITAAQAVYEEVSSGVVSIRAVGGGAEARLPIPGDEDEDEDDEGKGVSSGSGFVIDDEGTIITNAHVVGESKDVSVRFDEEGESIDAEVVGADPSTDIAVLKIPADEMPDLTPLELADSKDVKVGQAAVAIGNPFGLDRTATAGIVSGKGREIESPNGFQIDDIIQTDAPINPGSSGGPLLDAQGRVIGVNSQILTGGASRGNVGIGFAVPSNTVREVVPKLQRDGEIKRAYLGVSTLEITEEVAETLDIPQRDGALVVTVADGGPAKKAGLKGSGRDGKGGDIIVEVAGEKIEDPEDVARVVIAQSPGDTIEIVTLRGKQRKTFEVTLGDRPKETVE